MNAAAAPLADIEPKAHAAALTPVDLAELISSFNEVTARLQSTHETLRAEVARLNAELADTRTQLRRAQELAALGEMAAGIAHEVRNPLGSIRLYASVLAEDLAHMPPQREVALKIAGAVSRLNAVVSDVLAFARDLRVDAAPVEAGGLVRDAAETCRDLWRQHDIELRLPGADAGQVEIHADGVLLHQAVVNILRNSAEAVAEAGARDPARPRRVTVSLERRRSLTPDGARAPALAIVVEDTGPGIAPEVVERMFVPFFTTRHTGTGLGLAIVHRIVDAHSGRVGVHTVTDPATGAAAGTRVEILLPAPGAERTSFRGKAA